jgi:hypothetical protein
MTPLKITPMWNNCVEQPHSGQKRLNQIKGWSCHRCEVYETGKRLGWELIRDGNVLFC